MIFTILMGAGLVALVVTVCFMIRNDAVYEYRCAAIYADQERYRALPTYEAMLFSPLQWPLRALRSKP